MKIKKISKKGKNIYEINFTTGEKLNLYDDVILKYELLLKKDIEGKKLEEIINFNQYLDCYYKALKYINAKLRTEKEIQNKLKDYSNNSINYTLERLRKEGLLNKDLYIKAYINDEINLRITGPNKIIKDLKALGFKEEDINNYLNTIEEDIFLEKIKKYINKKINSNHELSSAMLKLKIIKELKNKGFYSEQINLVINDFDFIDNKEIYNKEYNKLKNRLSKKYSGNDLEYQIKIKMYQKGFKY